MGGREREKELLAGGPFLFFFTYEGGIIGSHERDTQRHLRLGLKLISISRAIEKKASFMNLHPKKIACTYARRHKESDSKRG